LTAPLIIEMLLLDVSDHGVSTVCGIGRIWQMATCVRLLDVKWTCSCLCIITEFLIQECSHL